MLLFKWLKENVFFLILNLLNLNHLLNLNLLFFRYWNKAKDSDFYLSKMSIVLIVNGSSFVFHPNLILIYKFYCLIMNISRTFLSLTFVLFIIMNCTYLTASNSTAWTIPKGISFWHLIIRSFIKTIYTIFDT
jgi:hypothetical protein